MPKDTGSPRRFDSPRNAGLHRATQNETRGLAPAATLRGSAPATKKAGKLRYERTIRPDKGELDLTAGWGNGVKGGEERVELVNITQE